MKPQPRKKAKVEPFERTNWWIDLESLRPMEKLAFGVLAARSDRHTLRTWPISFQKIASLMGKDCNVKTARRAVAGIAEHGFIVIHKAPTKRKPNIYEMNVRKIQSSIATTRKNRDQYAEWKEVTRPGEGQEDENEEMSQRPGEGQDITRRGSSVGPERVKPRPGEGLYQSSLRASSEINQSSLSEISGESENPALGAPSAHGPSAHWGGFVFAFQEESEEEESNERAHAIAIAESEEKALNDELSRIRRNRLGNTEDDMKNEIDAAREKVADLDKKRNDLEAEIQRHYRYSEESRFEFSELEWVNELEVKLERTKFRLESAKKKLMRLKNAKVVRLSV